MIPYAPPSNGGCWIQSQLSAMKSRPNGLRGDVKPKSSAVRHNAFAIVLILLAQLNGPTSDAQFNKYTALKRGQPCPYDSCVATEINQWRRESAFIKELRLENKSLYSETESLQREINLADSLAETFRAERDIMRVAIIRKDSINAQMANNLSTIHHIATQALKPKRWYERNITWFGVGVFGTLIILR